MKHPINPKIDCVFKALLGAVENSNLLIDFLNAMLGHRLVRPVVSVELLNPYNEKEFINDKLSIVDVKARDSQERIYQIEIQLAVYSSLPARILYSWCDLYRQQLKSGEDYSLLKPTFSVWLLDEVLFTQDKSYSRYFRLNDEQQRPLMEQGGIVVIELPKFHTPTITTSQERWLQFFNEAETFVEPHPLPNWMHTPEMEQAMTVLTRFSEKELAYHQYQARQNYLREQVAIQKDLQHFRALAEQAQQAMENAQKTAEAERAEKEQAQAAAEQAQVEKEHALAEKEHALAEKEHALAEKERLLALLKQVGIEP